MNDVAGDDHEFQIELVIDENEVGFVANTEETALFFADDASGNLGGHAQRRGETEAPFQIIFEHLDQGRAAAGHDGNAVVVFVLGDDEAFVVENDFQAAEAVFAGLATDRAAGIAHDGDGIGPFGGEDDFDHLDGDVIPIGNNFAGQRGVREKRTHAHKFGAEPAFAARRACGPIDGVVGVDEMAGAVGRGHANLFHGGLRVADGGNAAAFVEEAAEFEGTFSFRGVSEDADETVREFPEFIVFLEFGVAQAFNFVRATFGRIEIGAFDVDAEKIGADGAIAMLVAEGLQ